jgi:hypothetical protein
MFISYAKTAEEFRKEVVDMLRHDAERQARAKIAAKYKRDVVSAANRETELLRQATFFESIQFVERREKN